MEEVLKANLEVILTISPRINHLGKFSEIHHHDKHTGRVEYSYIHPEHGRMTDHDYLNKEFYEELLEYINKGSQS